MLRLTCFISLCLLSHCLTALPRYTAAQPLGQVADSALNELSGCAASRRTPSVLWVHNDSGDSARLFAITPQGQRLATVELADIPALDFEDIALGPGPTANTPYLYVGDIGDNAALRPWINVYRLPEPHLTTAPHPLRLEAETLTLHYPDGPQDAEALLLAPNGDLYLITKRNTPNRIYRFKAPLHAGQHYTGEYQGSTTIGWITAGDISPNGQHILLRNTLRAYLWHWPPGQTLAQALNHPPTRIPAKAELQGEAICWGWQGKGYFTVSEGDKPWVYEYKEQ